MKKSNITTDTTLSNNESASKIVDDIVITLQNEMTKMQTANTSISFLQPLATVDGQANDTSIDELTQPLDTVDGQANDTSIDELTQPLDAVDGQANDTSIDELTQPLDAVDGQTNDTSIDELTQPLDTVDGQANDTSTQPQNTAPIKDKVRKKGFLSVHDIAYSAVFVVLIILGAFIRIPIPFIPITFQTTFTTLAGLVLGAKLGGLSVVVYIIMGLCGIPVFSAGGGIGYVMQPSFGYIIGFFFGTILTGWLAHRPSPKNTYLRHFLAGLAGLLVVYVIGCFYIYFISKYALHINITASKIIVSYFLMLFPKDIALVAIACIASVRISPILARQGFDPRLKNVFKK